MLTLRVGHAATAVRASSIRAPSKHVQLRRVVLARDNKRDNYPPNDHLSEREKTLQWREARMWDRMEKLLDREVELRDVEQRHHSDREAALQSQVDMLLRFVAEQQPKRTLLGAHTSINADSAHRSVDSRSESLQSSNTLNDPNASSASREVQNAIDMVRNGTDVLAEVDFTLQGAQGDYSRATASSQNGNGVGGELDHPSQAMDSAESPAVDAPVPGMATGGQSKQPTGFQGVAAGVGGEMPPGVPVAQETPAALAGQAGEKRLEVAKAPPDAPPPVLRQGDDDIFWVGKLHAALLKHSFYCGEMDEDDLYFGTGTESAVLTFQAAKLMEETGIVDAAVWRELLGEDAEAAFAGRAAEVLVPEAEAFEGKGRSTPGNEGRDQGVESAFGGLFSGLGLGVDGGESADGESEHNSTPPENASQDSPTDNNAKAQLQDSHCINQREQMYTKWPTLREGDGDRAVHTMQIKLMSAGFHPDDDDLKWWNFGPTTQSALQTFQACNGLPDSGICSETTWKALMGEDARPEDISQVWSGDSYDEDLEQTGEGRVYLIGEQRWASI